MWSKTDSEYIKYLKHIHTIFGLNDIPLHGAESVVTEATEYRNAVLDKIAEGLAIFGESGELWLDGLHAAFVNCTDARWWLHKRSEFDSLEPSVLVQIFTFLNFAQEFEAMKLDTRVSVLEADGTVTRILP